jgi:aspartyl-tRNA(Asn)/glutamyl-tRNA(Gln) amidotransferase subunit C
MSITKEDVIKVANLARLNLTEKEQEEFAPQLNAILDYFEQLQELDTENVEPTTRAIDVSNITRPDEQITYSERESLLDSAPEREDDFFRVPKILAD